MARLSQLPTVLRTVGVWKFFKGVYAQIGDDLTLTWAASLAYSWLFAIFPFFIFFMTLVPLLPENMRLIADHEATLFLYSTLSKSDADALWLNMQEFLHQPRGGLLSVGLIVTLFAASGGINATMSALDRAYDIDQHRPFWKQRLLAMALTIGVAGLMILVILLLPVGNLVTRWLSATDGSRPWHSMRDVLQPFIPLINLARFALATLLMFAAVGLLYNFGPNIKQHKTWFSPGAIFTVVVWLILGLTFRFYVAHFGTTSPTYAAVGGAAILLLFFYIDAAVLLIGAEINSEIDFAVTGVPKGSNDFRIKLAEASLETKI